MIRRPPRSTQSRSSAASDVYKRQGPRWADLGFETDVYPLEPNNRSIRERREIYLRPSDACCSRGGDTLRRNAKKRSKVQKTPPEQRPGGVFSWPNAVPKNDETPTRVRQVLSEQKSEDEITPRYGSPGQM
eukprot:TRINITY_DN2748_c0_g1_i4.p1 TRINITY_DN2748_c0_g1~~TRINITY_DN2748_c0_g1_i4.p1  ORF type:complete len:131 (-),score=6.24 TRINITY_DN2748_c0_g1_i4:96-488(-)